MTRKEFKFTFGSFRFGIGFQLIEIIDNIMEDDSVEVLVGKFCSTLDAIIREKKCVNNQTLQNPQELQNPQKVQNPQNVQNPRKVRLRQNHNSKLRTVPTFCSVNFAAVL